MPDKLSYVQITNDPHKKTESPVNRPELPSDSDYQKGYLFRYFVQMKTDPDNIIEINKKQYDTHASDVGIDKELYSAIKFKWLILGQAYDFFKDDVRIVSGVIHSNKRIIELKDRKMPGLINKITQYSEYAIIQRNESSSDGATSTDKNHFHQYIVDEEGNGWALEASHSENPNIKHKHKIVNWEIQEAQSDCYPNCVMMYGFAGAPPHIHTMSATTDVPDWMAFN